MTAAGPRSSRLGHYQPSRVRHQRRPRRRWSTPTTSGSGTGSASTSAGSPTRRDGRRHGRGRGREGAGRLRPHRRRHRPGRRRHLLLGRPLPQRGHPGRRRSSASRAPAAYRPQHRLLRLLLRARPPPTTRSAPARPATRSSSAPRSSPTSPTGPTGPPASSSATAPAPRWSPRPPTTSRPASARCVWGSAPEKGDAITHRGLAAVHPAGGPDGLPLGHHRARPARPAGLRAGRRRTRASSPRSCRTRPTRASSTASPSGSNLPNAVIAKDIVESGNTSAASIPLALSKLVERRRGALGRPGAAVRLRRRPHLRRAGRPLPVSAGRDRPRRPRPASNPPERNHRT